MSSSSSIATCDSTTLSALLTDSHIQQCSTDSGYSFTAASIPTQDVIDLMCASSACRGLLADATALDLSECILPVGDNIRLRADLIDYVPARCPSASGSATSSTVGSTTEGTTTAGSTAGNETASSGNTITVPSSSSSTTSSTASSGETTPTTTSAPATASSSSTAASAAASASAASSSSGSSAAASPVGRAMGLMSIAALAVVTYCL